MSIFKAYDIRGIYGQDLTDEIAYKFGKAFVTFLGCKTVVVGQDMRESSPKIEKHLVKGLTEQGADVVLIGQATTPMLYYATAKFGFEAGINITASHNPPQYNGFKLVKKNAVPLSADTGIQDIRELVEKSIFPKSSKKGTVVEQVNLVNTYIENALSFVQVSKLKKFSIVADTGNGMAGIVIPELLKKIPCEFEHMFPELDGSFPNHEANPLKEETLRWLQAEVTNKKADIGVAFDGDADRIGFIDEKGQVIKPDLITALVSIELLKQNKGATILHDLRSSKIVAEIIKANSGNPIETRVGHSFIKITMREENAIFAGELSGHYYMKDNNYIDSPFIVLLLVLKIMTDSNKPLSKLIKPLKKYHSTGELNFSIEDKDAVTEKVKQAFSDAKRTYTLDGLSVVYDDFWFNLRPSNTEPVIRLTLESKSAKIRDEMREKLEGLLK